MKRYRMRTRWMLLYLLVAIIPIVVLFSVYLGSLTAQMEEEVSESMMQTLNQAALNMENDLKGLKSVSDYLFSSSSINEPLSTSPGAQKVESQLKELDVMNDTLQAAMESASLSSARVYVDDGKIYARERNRFFPLSDFFGSAEFTGITARGKFLMTTSQVLGETEPKLYVSYARLVKDMNQVGRTVGALVVNLDLEWFQEILTQMDFPEDSLIYLADSQGKVLLGDQQAELSLQDKMEGDFQYQQETIIRTKDRIYLVRYIELSDWYLVAELSPSDLSASRNNGFQLVLYIVLLMVFIGLVLIASSLIISGVARRVQQLALVFANEEEPVSPGEEEKNRRAFFRLFRSLDESLGSARSLIRASYEQMEQQRRTQLKLLQAQINPHFLYNTLDTIQWLVRAGRGQDSVNVISALTRYLRMILNNGKDVVTVNDEVEMTKAYLEIQRVRFGDIFDLDFIIEPDARDCLLPKMTLQPVIENALLHGIRTLTGRRGRMDVDIYREDGFLMIAITDNGMGMDQETSENLLELRPSREGGYGLYNVNQRILLFSGTKESGITVESEEGKYTMVTLRIAEKKETGKNPGE